MQIISRNEVKQHLATTIYSYEQAIARVKESFLRGKTLQCIQILFDASRFRFVKSGGEQEQLGFQDIKSFSKLAMSIEKDHPSVANGTLYEFLDSYVFVIQPPFNFADEQIMPYIIHSILITIDWRSIFAALKTCISTLPAFKSFHIND